MSKFMQRSVLLTLVSSLVCPFASVVLGGEAAPETKSDTKKLSGDHGQDVIKRILGLYNQTRPSGNEDSDETAAMARFVQAMKFVLENDKTLRMERCKILQSLGSIATAKGAFLPTLALNASVGYKHSPLEVRGKNTEEAKKKDPNLSTEEQKSWTKSCGSESSVALELSENLFSGGASLAKLKVATNANKAGYYQYKSTEGSVINDVFKIILEAIENLIMRQANDISVQIYREVVHIALQKLKVGEIDRSEVAQAEINLSKAESWAAEHRIKLEGLLGDVARKTGLTERDLLRLIPNFARFMPASAAEALKLAQKKNGNYLACHFDALAKKSAITAAQADYLPTLDVSCSAGGRKESKDSYRKDSSSGSYTKMSNTDTTGGADLSATLRFSWKFDTQGATRTAVKGAHHEYVRTTVAGSKVYSDLKSEIETDFANLKWCQDKVEAMQRHMKACEICFQATLQELSAGAKVYVQVLKALKDVMESYADLCKAKRILAETQLRIMMNTGNLCPETFHTTGFVFDPNFKETSYESPASRPQELPARKVAARQEKPQVVTVKAQAVPKPVITKRA